MRVSRNDRSGPKRRLRDVCYYAAVKGKTDIKPNRQTNDAAGPNRTLEIAQSA